MSDATGAGEGAPEQAPVETAARKPKAAPARKAPSLVVRYGRMRQVGEFTHNLGDPPPVGAEVVVRTERGVELGQVVAAVAAEGGPRSVSPERLAEFIRANGPEYPFRRGGRVLRLANKQDTIDQRHLETSAQEEAAFCREQIRELGLSMKVVSVEHLLGGERIVFYFAAESRVDFRELVRRLAGQYRTRIEMRQVGARDEARLVADYERCGRQCCCQEFLKDLKPVSMRMAKTQKATLDPSKISGRCGRLMCCLRYEDAGYEELRARLPKRNTWVRTAELVGRVADAQTLTQLVRLALPDGAQTVVANEDIVERNVPEPAPGEAPEPPPRRERKPRQPRSKAPQKPRAAEEQPAPAQAAPAGRRPTGGEQAGAPDAKGRKKRRRRPRGKGRSRGGQAKGPAGQKPKAQSGGKSQQGKSRKRRKRRRR